MWAVRQQRWVGRRVWWQRMRQRMKRRQRLAFERLNRRCCLLYCSLLLHSARLTCVLSAAHRSQSECDSCDCLQRSTAKQQHKHAAEEELRGGRLSAWHTVPLHSTCIAHLSHSLAPVTLAEEVLTQQRTGKMKQCGGKREKQRNSKHRVAPCRHAVSDSSWLTAAAARSILLSAAAATSCENIEESCGESDVYCSGRYRRTAKQRRSKAARSEQAASKRREARKKYGEIMVGAVEERRGRGRGEEEKERRRRGRE